MILSSHLLELIEALADRLLIIDRGKKVFLGTLAEARSSLSGMEGSSLEEIFFAATEAQGKRTPATPTLTEEESEPLEDATGT